MRQLSKKALNFINKQGKNKEYEINSDVLEKHLNFYRLPYSSEIMRFQEKFSGINIQDIIVHIFTQKQIQENKSVRTYPWKEHILFSINDSFYIAENGEIAFRNCSRDSDDFYFYYESFETFIEQQAFFEKYQYYKQLPALIGNNIIVDIDLIKEYFLAYDFVSECSDKYHLIWKNSLNLVQAINFPEGWALFFNSISEDYRNDLIKNLKNKKLIE